MPNIMKELLITTIRNRRWKLQDLGIDIYPEDMMFHAEKIWCQYWSYVDIKKETKCRTINILEQLVIIVEEWAKKRHIELTKEYGYLYA